MISTVRGVMFGNKMFPLYGYVYEDGEYVLMRGNEIIYRAEEISIAFSKEEEGMMWTLHKHGRKEFVQEWYDATVKNFRAHGFHDMANDLVMITGKFPVEEINKCLSTSGYIERMIKKLGLEV